MVFIHGGGFVQGSSKTDIYGPEYLMTGDIVLVTIQYRLGILGDIHKILLIKKKNYHFNKFQDFLA